MMEEIPLKSYPKVKAKGSCVALVSPSGPQHTKAKGPDKHLERRRSHELGR